MRTRATHLVLAALVIGGCGGRDNDDADPLATKQASPASTTAEQPEDLGRPLESSGPQATVREMSRLLRFGAVPGAADLYSKRLAAAVGRTVLVAALRQAAPAYAQAKLRVRGVRKTPTGTILLVQRVAPEGAPANASFIVRRSEGKWRIVYDSFLSDAVFAVVRARRQRQIDPAAKQESPEAVASATALQQQFDAIAGAPPPSAEPTTTTPTTTTPQTATTG